MRYPWANIALLLLLSAQLITGFFGFINGAEDSQWVLWLHGIGAYAIATVLLWKSAIILDVYGRGSGMDWRRVTFAVMALLLVATLVSGLAWTFNGPHFLLGFSLITLHIFVAVALAVLLVWHTLHFRWILRLPRAVGRRSFLRTSLLGFAGFIAWRGATTAKLALRLPGSERRFTGSYEIGSFTGQFPRVSWIADNPPPIDVLGWRLVIDGAVDRPLLLSYKQLCEMDITSLKAILDCTGGWYSEQLWRGVKVAHLLELAGVADKARSVTFKAVTGYERRFTLDESRHYLLATTVAGEQLGHGHGFPLRLVAPDQRGVNWVKWLSHIHLNKTGKLWQIPLPLQ
jgi:DMSO/TMAO reductase YedYZ molybdopterin-dependent catalytic subunit